MFFAMLRLRLINKASLLPVLSIVLMTVLVMLMSSASALGARYASIVMDADTGQVIYARHANSHRYPASLTKMMTLYLTFDALNDGRLKLGQKLTASKRAVGMPPSRLGLKKGGTITVRDAILALVTKSANDAAVVLAEAQAGTEIEFAKVMTSKAKSLGMTRTSFRNASGLHNRHQKTTAQDMAKLALALLRNHAEFYHYFSNKSFAYKGRTYRNHNSLLSYYKGTDGIKTGYVRASGFNLVASTERQGRRLIGVVFGGKSSKSRDAHMRTLLDRGFKHVTRAVVATPDRPRRNPRRIAARTAPQTQQTASLAPTPPPAAPPPSVTPPPSVAAALNGIIPSRTLSEEGSRGPLPADDWGVQVGAFSRFAPAQLAATQAARRLPDILLHTHPVIEPVQANAGSQLFRAQLVGLSEGGAREACRRLKEMRQSCVVVPPQSAALVGDVVR
jgi:D-alanyl-D-alanine carboxypeptidase